MQFTIQCFNKNEKKINTFKHTHNEGKKLFFIHEPEIEINTCFLFAKSIKKAIAEVLERREINITNILGRRVKIKQFVLHFPVRIHF